jgi:hypothetical protein
MPSRIVIRRKGTADQNHLRVTARNNSASEIWNYFYWGPKPGVVGWQKKKIEKDEGKAGQSAVQTPQTKKAADPGQLSKSFYARPVEGEPVPETVLTELAEVRARAIVAALTGDGGVTPERLSTKPPDALPKAAPVTAKLFLIVARKSS